MTVYIEYVLIDNFVIDYLLLKATLLTLGRRISKARLFTGAVIGAVVALTFPLLYKVKILQTAVKILSGFLMVAIVTEQKEFRVYYINALLFFAYTFTTGGAITGIFHVFNIDQTQEVCTALMILPVYIILKFVLSFFKYLYAKKEVASLSFDITLIKGERKIEGVGFFDSGNLAFDEDRPIIVCTREFFRRFIGSGAGKFNLKKISLETVGGKTQNYATQLDELWIYNGDEPNIFNNVMLCVSKVRIGDGYDVILHPSLLSEGNYVQKSDRQAQKVS